jgi:hypothetical protein
MGTPTGFDSRVRGVEASMPLSWRRLGSTCTISFDVDGF